MKTAVVHQNGLSFVADLDACFFVVANVMIFFDAREILITLDVDTVLMVLLDPVVLHHSV